MEGKIGLTEIIFLIAIASGYVLAFALRKRERKMPERQSGGATD